MPLTGVQNKRGAGIGVQRVGERRRLVKERKSVAYVGFIAR